MGKQKPNVVATALFMLSIIGIIWALCVFLSCSVEPIEEPVEEVICDCIITEWTFYETGFYEQGAVYDIECQEEFTIEEAIAALPFESDVYAVTCKHE